jgi:hypothetical protein
VSELERVGEILPRVLASIGPVCEKCGRSKGDEQPERRCLGCTEWGAEAQEASNGAVPF